MSLPSSTNRLVKDCPGPSFEYREVSLSPPQGDELLVRVGKVALCGTDISLYLWNNVAEQIAEVPFTPGHEMVGEIVAVGPEVPPEYAVGKRVCVENHFYCGHCYQCTHDLQHICQNLNQFGYGKGTKHGGLSQFTIIPAKYAYLLKTSLEDSKAAILEPCGVAHQALEGIGVNGEDILIQGMVWLVTFPDQIRRCGPVGLLAIGVARVLGATKILAADIVERRLESARLVGADVIINCKTEDLKTRVLQETAGNGIGRLFEATGAPSMVNNCFSLLRKGGKIAMIGLTKAPLHVENPLQNVIFKSITLKTFHGRRIFRDWEQSEKMLFEKLVNTDPIITHDFPLSKFEEAYRVLMSGEGCKVLVTPGE